MANAEGRHRSEGQQHVKGLGERHRRVSLPSYRRRPSATAVGMLRDSAGKRVPRSALPVIITVVLLMALCALTAFLRSHVPEHADGERRGPASS